MKTNRDAGQKQKGFRLQKLRAVELLFLSLAKNENTLVYCATETDEDVNHVEVTKDEKKEYLEQDKAYDPESSFTFNNEHVLSTLANFIYCWAARNFSNTVNFGFYTTNKFGKERSTDKSNSLGISFPDEAIIKLLIDEKYEYQDVLETIKSLVCNHLEGLSPNDPMKVALHTLRPWAGNDMKDFLSRVSWKFGQEDTQELQQRVLSQIYESSLYRKRSLVERGELVLSRLMDLLDERQSNVNPTERFVYGGDVKLVLLEVSSGEYRVDDPTWRLWESITVSDSRGLEEKIKAVCNSFSKRKIKSLSRKAAAGLSLHQQASRDKGVLSARYRVYQTCKDILDEFIELAAESLNEIEIESKIDEMVEAAYSNLQVFGRDHYYPVSNKASVTEIMLELVDSCYLAFDEVEEE